MKQKVTGVEAGQRLDVFITLHLPALSRSAAGKLIDNNKVTVNAQAPKASQKLKAGDTVQVEYQTPEIPTIDLPILYEDDDCLVIDKPAGILTHNKGAFNPEATVASFIAPKLSGLSGERGGIVHRLDRLTSGVIICAKNPSALSWLQKQFSERKTKKKYVAMVTGQLNPTAALIDKPIERNPKRPQSFRVGANGKPARTAYCVLAANAAESLVELRPETGRTHQLRVHLSQLGHPIVGDVLYGGPAANRVYLHALSLELTLPDKSRRVFESLLPPEFRNRITV
jgi:23S rRNA pseudouridine1911/1915/1917 synthase